MVVLFFSSTWRRQSGLCSTHEMLDQWCWANVKTTLRLLAFLLSVYSANMRHGSNVESMLGHRLRRWPNIDPTSIHLSCMLGTLIGVDQVTEVVPLKRSKFIAQQKKRVRDTEASRESFSMKTWCCCSLFIVFYCVKFYRSRQLSCHYNFGEVLAFVFIYGKPKTLAPRIKKT